MPATEIRFGSTPRPSARYVSSTTVREEALVHGRLLGLYWSACGQVQRENIANGLPGLNPLELPLHAFELEIDGQDLRNRWELVATSERSGPRGTREAVMELRHQVRPVSVRVVTRLDGTPILARWLEITNTGDRPAALSAVSPLSGLLWSSRVGWDAERDRGPLPPGQSPFTIGHFDGHAQGSEGNLVFEALPRGGRRFASSNGRSGWGAPYFLIRNEITGECAVGGLAWSGNWSLDLWLDPWQDLDGRSCRGDNLCFRMRPEGVAPLRLIAPGETVRSPELHLGLLRGDATGAAAAMHAHLRASVIPPRPAGKAMYSIAGRVVEEPGEWILREIDIAAEMGVEAIMVDAGWYGGSFGDGGFGGWWGSRGDWQEAAWLPSGGLAACRERCHQRGLLFGLWMEPESVGPESRLLQEHPDWMLRTDGGREVAQWVLDLANPEAARFLEDSVLRVIREHRLDFFKIDYNVTINEGGQRERDGYAEHETWRHYECLDRTFARVRSECPEVALENCAAGGGRNDLAMLARCHYSCESDFSEFPRSIRAIAGLTAFIPPEALVYYHNHAPAAHHRADLDTHLRVSLFAQAIHVGFGAQDADRGTPFFDATRRYLQLARAFTQPILAAQPAVFNHTPGIGSQGPAPWCVLEYAARDRSRGYAGIFRIGAQAGHEWLFRPRGLDPARRYRVTLDNQHSTIELNGAELVLHGIPVRLEGLNASELLLFEAC